MFNRGLTSKHTKAFLTPNQPKVARFYLLPKIHKPDNQERPIVLSNGIPTENISQYVDHFLQPLVTRVPSYVRDTTDFLLKPQQIPHLPAGCLLVTLDVSSLYTNIPHSEGIIACKEALSLRVNKELLLFHTRM